VGELPVVTTTVPASRDDAAALLLHVLSAACTAGDVCLIGSMARREEADEFSDIDVRWTIPPMQASGQLQSLRVTLQRVGNVESLRIDPEPRPDSRLVFVRFQDWPLWWRVDLEIHSAGLGSLGVQGSDAWSPSESACMGVLVTLKAIARNRPEAAERLWVRALKRVDAADVPGGWEPRIDALLDFIETRSPEVADLVSRTRQLTREVLSG
jgi:predicted nucleotidyltransferase